MVEVASEVVGDCLLSDELPVSMVERIALILQTFEGAPLGRRYSLETICQRTGLARSTAHRILDQLVKVRWLSHSAKGYELGGRLLGMCSTTTGDGRLRAAAEPLLRQVHAKTGYVVHLAVPEAHRMRYLMKFAAPGSAVPSQVGALVPAHASALGRAYLAAIAPERVDRIFREGLQPLTPRTIQSLSMLHTDLARIRQRHGLAHEIGEVVDSVACLAAPVHDSSDPIGSISIVASSPGQLTGLGPVLLNVARQISARLCGGAGAVTA